MPTTRSHDTAVESDEAGGSAAPATSRTPRRTPRRTPARNTPRRRTPHRSCKRNTSGDAGTAATPGTADKENTCARSSKRKSKGGGLREAGSRRQGLSVATSEASDGSCADSGKRGSDSGKRGSDSGKRGSDSGKRGSDSAKRGNDSAKRGSTTRQELIKVVHANMKSVDAWLPLLRWEASDATRDRPDLLLTLYVRALQSVPQPQATAGPERVGACSELWHGFQRARAANSASSSGASSSSAKAVDEQSRWFKAWLSWAAATSTGASSGSSVSGPSTASASNGTDVSRPQAGDAAAPTVAAVSTPAEALPATPATAVAVAIRSSKMTPFSRRPRLSKLSSKFGRAQRVRSTTPSPASVGGGGSVAALGVGGLSPVHETNEPRLSSGSTDTEPEADRADSGSAGVAQDACATTAASSAKAVGTPAPTPKSVSLQAILTWTPPKRAGKGSGAASATSTPAPSAAAAKQAARVAPTPGIVIPSGSPVISFKVRKGRGARRAARTAAQAAAAPAAPAPAPAAPPAAAVQTAPADSSSSSKDAPSDGASAPTSGDTEVVFNIKPRRRSRRGEGAAAASAQARAQPPATPASTLRLGDHSSSVVTRGTRASSVAPSPAAGGVSGKSVYLVNGHRYIRLSRIGRGGTSTVYKVLRERDGAIFALKRVDLRATSAGSVANELKLLESLQGHPNIISLEEYETTLSHVLMVMELGETDLSSLIQRERKDTGLNAARAASAGTSLVPVIDVNLLRWVWQGMLRAVDTIHQQRIVHGDLKPANFVLVKGKLKLIDFGIADAICGDTTNIYRDSQVGTVNYMAPEAIGTNGVGRASDIWSLGCILYEMVFGRKPFAHVRGNPINKLLAIANPATKISFAELEGRVNGTAKGPAGASAGGQVEADLLDVLHSCLNRDARARPPISSDTDSSSGGPGAVGLLQHAFLVPPARTKPAADACPRCEACAGEGEGDSVRMSRAQLSALLRQLSSGASLRPDGVADAVDAVARACSRGSGVEADGDDVGALVSQWVARGSGDAASRAERRSSTSSVASGASRRSSASCSSASTSRRSSRHKKRPRSTAAHASRAAGTPHRAGSGGGGGTQHGGGKPRGSAAVVSGRVNAELLQAAMAKLQPMAKRQRRDSERVANSKGDTSAPVAASAQNQMTLALRERLARIRRATGAGVSGNGDGLDSGSESEGDETM